MIRSIGSSLLAKAGTGSLTRKKEETRMTKPEVPGKGAVGTATRDLTQETNITPTAPGSEKVIRSAPGIESASLPGIAANQVPLVAGMGTPGGAPKGIPAGGNQPMFAGAGGQPSAPASAPGQAGRQAIAGASTGTPKGAVAAAREAGIQPGATTGAVSRYEAGRVPFGSANLPDIGIFGSRVSADTGGKSAAPSATPAVGAGQGEWQPTAGQYVAGKIGNLINTIGQKLGNPLPNANISEKLERYGGSKSVAATGKGSVTKAIQNVGNALRSVTQSAKNTFGNLRSKIFGR